MGREPMSDRIKLADAKIGELEHLLAQEREKNARLRAIMVVLKSALDQAEKQ